MYMLRDASDEVLDTITKGMLNYWELKPRSRKAYQIDQVQFSQALAQPHWNNKKGVDRDFVLPIAISDTIVGGAVTDELQHAFQHRICIWAWCELHTIGKRRYCGLKQCAVALQIPLSKNTGNQNRRRPLAGALDSARNKLKWAADNLACPFATKIVKDMAGLTSLRYNPTDDSEQLVFLPPNATVRGLWLDWVHERGWDPVKTCRSSQIFAKKEDWVRSPGCYETQEEVDAAEHVLLADDTLVPPQVSQPVVTLPCFRQLWKREFSYLKVRGRGEDTCTD